MLSNMRCLSIFFLLLPLWVSAQHSILENRITISLSDVTLEVALSAIGKMANTEFAYGDDAIPVDSKVSILAKDQELKEVLKTLLQNFQIEFKVSHSRIVFRKALAPLTQTVRGVIVDANTQLPIQGANIIIASVQPLLGGTSEQDGKFKITKVPVGRVTIQISSVGYQSRILSNVLLGTGKELVLDVKLVESIIDMDEVVVTPNQKDLPMLPETNGVSNQSFSVEETKRYAGSLGDPARMASGFAGVTNASDESNALIVRGNSPRGVLWRIDGIEVPNPNHFASEGSSNGIISILSSNIVDNSNFLTSAFPASYGNALSAVFDMKLRSGNNERREHSFQAGLLGLEASTEGPFNKRKRSSYLVNYRYSTLNILDKLGVGLNRAGEIKNYQDLSFKLDFPTANNGRLSIFGIGGLSRSNRAVTSALSNDGADMGVIGATYHKALRENTLLTTAISWSGTGIINYNEVLDLSLGTVKVEANYHKSYARASVGIDQRIADHFFLKSGIIYSQLFYNFYLRNLDPSNQAYQEIVNFQEQGNTKIVQAFLTAQQNFSSSITGSYGVHFIQFGLTNDFSIEPRANIRWQAAPNKAFSIGYGKHSRIENLQYYLARDHQVGGKEVQINKNLSFTRADHYVAGYEQTFDKGHRLRAEAYFQQLYNVPVQSNPSSIYATINEDTGFITDTLLNNGRGKNYGVELSLEKSFSSDFYYLLNGSLYRSKFQVADGPELNTSFNGNYNFHLLVGKEFKLKNHSVIGVNIKMTTAGGKRYVPINLEKSINESRQVYDWGKAFDAQLPDYFRSDFQLVYRRNKPRYSTEWRVDVQNVSNHINPSYYYYSPSSKSIELKNQVGLLPIFSYRIEF
jgi:hypothetical protein